ncbi:MAG: response regulator [Alphaproteobacteria bacterium]|nr:response regulator [Alphaproteobacteria bacterium]
MAEREESDEAHRKLALVEALAGVGHWRFDFRTRRGTWSPQVYRIHGAAPGDLDPSDASVVDLLHPEDRAVLLAHVARAEATGAGYEARLRLNRLSDGAQRIVIVKAEVERDDAGAPAALFGVFQDITDQERAVRDAEAAVRAKLNFLANISHELRTPLSSILGFSRLLEQAGDLPEDAHRCAARIVGAGETLLAIVNDLLDLAAADASSLRLRMERVRVRDLVQSTLDLVEADAAAKGLLLAARIAPDAPDWVMGDGGRLRQVLLNLVANAVKFTDAGAVRVHAAPAGRALRFSVIDTGPGVPEDRQAQIVSRFAQADADIGARYGGAGLGLAISKRLVALMGGAIGVESKPGAGAAFWFVVPLAPADVENDVAPVARALDILLIEDHAAIQDIISAVLAPFGCRIAIANDGADAVRRAAARAYDLILADAAIPALPGPEAVRAIRSAGANRRTPIIALSAHSDPRVEAAFLRAGADLFLPKPIVVRDLLAAIARVTTPATTENAPEDWALEQA